MHTYTYEQFFLLFLKHQYSTFFSISFLFHFFASFNINDDHDDDKQQLKNAFFCSKKPDIMRKTVKLMISISNKSNPIITNSSLISSEIMRCLHQHRMLIYWKVTTIQPIPIQIGITIIIIDIRMPHQVRKVRINFFPTSYFIS
jgi:hypothetical protein